MSGITLRRAAPEDAHEIAAGLADLAEHLGVVTAMDAGRVLAHGFGPEARFDVMLAEAGADVLGLALYFRHFSTLRGCPGVYVQDLWVGARARGRGVGLALLKGVARRAQADWGAGYLALSVDRANEGAERFYRRAGFAAHEDDLPMYAEAAVFRDLAQG